MEMFHNFNFSKFLILALKSDFNKFFVFKRLSAYLFQRGDPHDEISNIVALSVSCAVIVFYIFEFILKDLWY